MELQMGCLEKKMIPEQFFFFSFIGGVTVPLTLVYVMPVICSQLTALAVTCTFCTLLFSLFALLIYSPVCQANTHLARRRPAARCSIWASQQCILQQDNPSSTPPTPSTLFPRVSVTAPAVAAAAQPVARLVAWPARLPNCHVPLC